MFIFISLKASSTLKEFIRFDSYSHQTANSISLSSPFKKEQSANALVKG